MTQGSEGRVILESDPKASCGQRRSAAMLETIVFARRYQPETKSANAKPVNVQPVDIALRFQNSTYRALVDAKGLLNLRSLQPGTYRIDPREPASGWYLRAIALDSPAKNPNIARDGLKLATGERLSGLSIMIAEGAGQLKGQISSGQSTSQALRVYLVPAEPEAADNVLRFYEARPEADQSFTLDNINPGKYFIVAHSITEKDTAKSIRQDSNFRATISREAAAAKKEISFKPCQQIADYELTYSP